MPTSWDDTKLVDDYPGVYCALARWKERNWFLAMMHGQTPVTTGSWWYDTPKDPSRIPYTPKFLGPGVEYTLRLYHDGEDRDTIVTATSAVTSLTVLTVPRLEGGRFCGYLTSK